MTLNSRLSALALVITLVGCGGKSFDEGGGGGSSSQGNTGNVPTAGSAAAGSSAGGSGQVGGSGNAGSTPMAGISSGGTAQGGQGGDACESFNDEIEMTIGVEILNDTTQPIYIGAQTDNCGSTPLFAVQDPAGRQLLTESGCGSSCDLVRKQGAIACPTICRQPFAIALQPGESYSTYWTGLDYVDTKLPPECVIAPLGVGLCTQAVRIEPGSFTFSSVAATGIECSRSSAMCDNCQPDGNGGCTINGALLGERKLKAATTVLLDGSYGIYPKAAPAQGDAAPATGGSGAIALPRVVIVFK